MDNMTIFYLAMGIEAVIIAFLLYVVLRQSQGLAVSIPPAAFPLILNFIQHVVQLTPTKTDDAVLGGLFPETVKPEADSTITLTVPQSMRGQGVIKVQDWMQKMLNESEQPQPDVIFNVDATNVAS